MSEETKIKMYILGKKLMKIGFVTMTVSILSFVALVLIERED